VKKRRRENEKLLVCGFGMGGAPIYRRWRVSGFWTVNIEEQLISASTHDL